VSNGLADANARKEQTRAVMAKCMVIKENMTVDVSGECEGDTGRCRMNNVGKLPWYLYSTKRQCYERGIANNTRKGNGARRFNEIRIAVLTDTFKRG
jgi:hypothetical protein